MSPEFKKNKKNKSWILKRSLYNLLLDYFEGIEKLVLCPRNSMSPEFNVPGIPYAPLIGYIVLEKSRLESKNNSFWYNNLNQHCRL